MNNNKFLLTTGAIALAVTSIFYSCSKDINDRTSNLPALNPASTDANAGTWKPVLLQSSSEITVAAPAPTTTPDYIAQLNEIKATQAELTDEEKRIVKYWGAGGILRWNEILRELVAKHNLPPYQNDDGTYPFPSANNPLAYPLFPFSNPPYAARAYAYVSAAQYDALVAAWHYKYLYNRPAPDKVDESINRLIPGSDLPSYPSEDAVIAGAATEMLKLLFPGDQDFIQAMAEEHKKSRIIAGANVRSELEAGEALGKAVAQKFVARARGDYAGAAAGNAASWKKLEDDCIARGEEPWYSLELPKRPPMLPGFGRVKPFLFDSLTVIAIRPGPPPSVTSAKMQEEVKEVNKFITKPTREQTRIVHYWADGVGTYTPPGHWDAIAAEDFIKKDFSEVRWARNMALINMALMDAAIVCWDTKYFYFNPRPTQLDPSIKTLTGIPNFPAYISGHSTFSGAAATILGHIIPERAKAYSDMAAEASISRVYGGIHYRSDCAVGLTTGNKVGEYAIQRARTDGAE
ncbi:vanadium-dependent haloperoxidase [Flavihumibacter sp. CACIAM 22H1]|uniref:vanadium-dependent haloperoxidase n=1 Tax=Flavihumibacter sp. CACIAM 22H1 TaxID=1812911 RepID=UPI0007A8C82A|nr:vanadium-dependent haloperoxidase [Flavihumibacter sp. CACIAM 22H1]KYP15673.1 MAG: PA-phosphatase [Flavihumibacter sp. CACIAM 22H1]